MRLLLFVIIGSFFTGCYSDLFDDHCGENVKVGEFEMLETSLSFFSYSKGNLELLFEDQDGVEHLFKQLSFEEKDDEYKIVKMLCEESLTDYSYEFFNHESKIAKFRSQQGDEISMHLYTSEEGPNNINETTVFDRIVLKAKIDFIGVNNQFRFITGYHQNGPLSDSSSSSRKNYKLIPDTLINNYRYNKVYEYNSFNGDSIFYTPKDGIFLISNSEGEFLRLKK